LFDFLVWDERFIQCLYLHVCKSVSQSEACDGWVEVSLWVEVEEEG